MVRPMTRLGLYLAEIRAWPTEGGRVHQCARGERHVSAPGPRSALRVVGAAADRATSPTPASVPWASSGWTNDRNVTQMLAVPRLAGEVAVAGRQGRQRSVGRVRAHLSRASAEGRPGRKGEERSATSAGLRALGVARPEHVGDAGIPVEIEGTTGEWHVDPDASAAGFKGRTAILSPFDRLIHDRTRARCSCSTSTTRSRCTSRRASGDGATSRCPCSTATRSWGRSTRSQTARRRRYKRQCHPRRRGVHVWHDQGSERRARVAASLARARAARLLAVRSGGPPSWWTGGHDFAVRQCER